LIFDLLTFDLFMRIKDVAQAAGVSTATVSHVINNTRYVTDETRARVLETIERLNYYPNAQARSLALGRSSTLGLVISDITNPFFPDLVKSIERAAFERGYDVVLANTSYDLTRTSNYVRRFIERKLAGVLLMTSELDKELIEELQRQSVAVVFLDLGRTGAHMSNIVVDYEQGIEEAVIHLCALHHERFAFIGGPEHFTSALKRRRAFENSLARHSPEAQALIYESDFQLEGGWRTATEIFSTLSPAKRPTAFVVANDLMALGVVRACRAANLNVPDDVSIVGFDDIAFADLADPPLTTVRLPRDELGVCAIEALMQTIQHPDGQGVEMHIATHLVMRASTSRAPDAVESGGAGQS
jgi:LacI family transcriptional regulator